MTTTRYVLDGTIIVLALSHTFWLVVAILDRQKLQQVRADYAMAERMLSMRIVLEAVDVDGASPLVDVSAMGAYGIARYGGVPGPSCLDTIWPDGTGPGIRLVFREPA